MCLARRKASNSPRPAAKPPGPVYLPSALAAACCVAPYWETQYADARVTARLTRGLELRGTSLDAFPFWSEAAAEEEKEEEDARQRCDSLARPRVAVTSW